MEAFILAHLRVRTVVHHGGEGWWQECEAAVHSAPVTLRSTARLHPTHADLSLPKWHGILLSCASVTPQDHRLTLLPLFVSNYATRSPGALLGVFLTLYP